VQFEQAVIDEGVGGFPVVEAGHLVGIVTRSDVVRQLSAERTLAEKTSDFYFDERGFHEKEPESLKDVADRVGERLEALTVADVMAKDPRTVPQELVLSDVARRFLEHKVHRFPVTENDRLVGVITTTDLVRLIAHKRIIVRS